MHTSHIQMVKAESLIDLTWRLSKVPPVESTCPYVCRNFLSDRGLCLCLAVTQLKKKGVNQAAGNLPWSSARKRQRFYVPSWNAAFRSSLSDHSGSSVSCAVWNSASEILLLAEPGVRMPPNLRTCLKTRFVSLSALANIGKLQSPKSSKLSASNCVPNGRQALRQSRHWVLLWVETIGPFAYPQKVCFCNARFVGEVGKILLNLIGDWVSYNNVVVIDETNYTPRK